MHSDLVCGLDIGSSSIRAVIAQAPGEKILGIAESPTRGFSKSVVTNLNVLSDAVEDAISKAETLAHCRVRKVVTNISGVHIRTFKSRGSIHISDRPSEITKDDIKRCIDSARLIAMSLDREVIHLIPERFYIDDKMEISDPLSLFGSKLDVDLNIITSLVSILHNLTRAINLAGYEVEEMVTSGSGTCLSVFDEKELQEGAVVIDVGKDITEASLFLENKLQECFYFPFGGDDLTQVLQDRMRIMFEDAEALKIKYGVSDKANFEIDGDARRREVSNLLFPKIEEIMQEVYKKITPFLKKTKRLPHICVVGGVSKMDGFIEAVEEIFSVKVSMGRLRNVKDLHDINFACSLGLMRYGSSKTLKRRSRFSSDTDNFVGRFISRIQNLASEYF